MFLFFFPCWRHVFPCFLKWLTTLYYALIFEWCTHIHRHIHTQTRDLCMGFTNWNSWKNFTLMDQAILLGWSHMLASVVIFFWSFLLFQEDLHVSSWLPAFQEPRESRLSSLTIHYADLHLILFFIPHMPTLLCAWYFWIKSHPDLIFPNLHLPFPAWLHRMGLTLLWWVYPLLMLSAVTGSSSSWNFLRFCDPNYLVFYLYSSLTSPQILVFFTLLHQVPFIDPHSRAQNLVDIPYPFQSPLSS